MECITSSFLLPHHLLPQQFMFLLHLAQQGNSPELWHNWLGHIPYHLLNKIPSITVPHMDSPSPYLVCPTAKQTRLSFTPSHTTTTYFETLHCDLWGLYRTPLMYTHLKTFGSLAFASAHSTDKFAARALQCVFIGYPMHQKGYKLFDLHTKQVFVSCCFS